MRITEYNVEEIKDPTGILTGRRFEYFLHIEIEDEEDDLFGEDVHLRVLFSTMDDQAKMLNYHFYESKESKYLDYGLSEEEEKLVEEFCINHLPL